MSFDKELHKAEKRITDLAKKAGDHPAITLNETAFVAREQAVDKIAEQVMLDKRYIRENLTVVTASKDELGWKSEIRARRRGVLLTRFGHKAVFGPRASGDGTKQVGIEGQIKPQKSFRANFFYIRLKGGATGIAKRAKPTGRENYRVLHGPSVSQVFDTVREDISDTVRKELEASLMKQLEKLYG